MFSSDIKVNKIRSDQGSEFHNKYVRRYLKQLNVKYFTNNPPKANYAERVQRTFKEKLYRYFSYKRLYRYIDNLQSLVDSYSNTGHKSLGYLSPNDITEDNEADLWYYLYLKTTPKKSLKHKKSQSVNKHKK